MTLLLFIPLACAVRAQTAAPAVGSVVRSKEWIVRRGANREEEFRGDVRYESSGTRVNADWAVYRHASRQWRARGDVRLLRILKAGDEIEARGELASYDEKTRLGALDPAAGGLVRLRRTPAGGAPDWGEGGRLSWQGEESLFFSGGIRVWGPRLEAQADSARYESSGTRLTLEGGRPVARKMEGEWLTALKADRIEATQDPRFVEAHGRVKGWLIFKDPAKLKESAR